MTETEIIELISNVSTMPELDKLRIATVQAMEGGDKNKFYRIQKAFRRAKKRINRTPLRDRTW